MERWNMDSPVVISPEKEFAEAPPKTDSRGRIAPVGKQGPDSVCLLGALLDSHNLGCKALAASLITSVKEISPEARITLIYPNEVAGERTVMTPEGIVTVNLINYRHAPTAKPSEQILVLIAAAALYRMANHDGLRRKILGRFPTLKALAEGSVIADVRGGDSFSDVYGVYRIVYGLFPVILTRLLGKRIVFLPQTYGPFRGKLARMLARLTLSSARIIFARDKESIERLKELAGRRGFRAPVRFCPDTAFILESAQPLNGGIPLPIKRRRRTPLIGCNLSGLLYQGREGGPGGKSFGLKNDYRDLARTLIETLIWRTDGDVLLVPHVFGGPESDVTACTVLFEEWRDSPRVFLLRREYDQHEIKWIIGQCDFFVGSRMHACIAALSQGVPAVGIAYSPKFRGVFETVSCPDSVVDARSAEIEEIMNQTVEWYWNRDILRERLSIEVPRVREKIRSEMRKAWIPFA